MRNFWVKLIILNEIEEGILRVTKPLLKKRWSDEYTMAKEIQETIMKFYDANPQYDDFQQYITFVLNMSLEPTKNLSPIYVLDSLDIHKAIT